MKKFFSFVAAALVSAAMFAAPASVPTVAQVEAQYDATSNVVLVVYFDEQVCNDVVFMGNYCKWSMAEPTTPYTEITTGEALEGFNGWYVFVAPAMPEVEKWVDGELVGTELVALQAKPVQLKKDGSFSWDYQTGDVDSWEHHAGSEISISAGYDGESNLEYPAAGVYIYESKYFKNHNSPCVEATYHDYNITLYAPDCGGFKPAIIGDFNGWAAGAEMVEDVDDEGNLIYTYSFNDSEGHAFKFRQAGIDDWANQIRLYNEETSEWYDNGNISLGAKEDLVIDYSAGTYTLCGGEEAVETVKAEAAATKVVRNGQLVIIKGNATYNVLGAELK